MKPKIAARSAAIQLNAAREQKAKFLMQTDPHDLYPKIEYFYLFLVLACLSVGILIFVAAETMRYLDSRSERKRRRKNSDETRKNV